MVKGGLEGGSEDESGKKKNSRERAQRQGWEVF